LTDEKVTLLSSLYVTNLFKERNEKYNDGKFERQLYRHFRENTLQEKRMESKSALEATLVQEFVSKSHGDLERVKELLTQEPALINAAWDWGGGDWETGLGAAAHMGRRDIANYLLEHGARLDLFAAAMLGKLEIVRATLEAYPEAINIPGPHGIPLIAHAQAGGSEAIEVYDYLTSLASQNTITPI
jgi:hypothetical protein